MALTEPYGLDPEFEKVVLYYCVTSAQFWSQVGYALDGDALGDPSARLIVETCRLIAREMGRGPESVRLVVQRLSRRVNEGKVTAAQVQTITALIDDVQDSSPPAVVPVINELIPIIRRQLQSAAIVASHAEYAKKGDFQGVRALFEKASRIGVIDQIAGVKVGASGFDRIELAASVSRVPTGILELDLQLNGGLPQKSLTVWVGDAGSGKSQALIHQVGQGMRQHMFCGFITLELPEHVQLARLFGNLTGVEVTNILDVKRWRDEAQARMTLIESQVGLCELAEFSPHATSVQDLIEWVEQKEQHHGAKMQLLVIDYADKMRSPEVKDNNEYLAMRYVYEGLRRDIAVARSMWVVTGSQAGRASKESAKRLDMHHIADSMHKVRVADVVVTLNPREDGTMELFVAKNRLGKSRYVVGPLQTDFSRGRFVPVTREMGGW